MKKPKRAKENADPPRVVFKNTASHGGGECNGKVNKQTKPKPKCLRVIGYESREREKTKGQPPCTTL